MMFSLVFCCQIFPRFRIFLALPNWLFHPPLIDPKSPCLLLSKFSLWFQIFFPFPMDNSHPPLIRSLVFCYCVWSSAIKYFVGFELSLHLPIYCPIHPWSILNNSGLLLLIDSHRYLRSLAPTHVTSDILLSSLVLCCQILLWFRIFLSLPNW